MQFPGRFSNPCLNRANLNTVTQQPKIWQQYGMIRIHAEPFIVRDAAAVSYFTGKNIGKFALVYNAGKCSYMKVKEVPVQKASLIGELLAPLMPVVKLMSLADARARLVGVATEILKKPTCLRTVMPAADCNGMVETVIAHLNTNFDFFWEGRGVEDGVAPSADQINNLGLSVDGQPASMLTWQTAYKILWFIASSVPDSANAKVVEAIAITLVAMTKRGNATTDMLERVKEGVKSDVNATIDLQQEEVQSAWKVFSASVSSEIMPYVVAHFLSLMPENCLRFTITIQHAAGSGLTTFILVMNKIKAHIDFPWGFVANKVPTEWANVIAGLQQNGGNVWKGFDNEKGPCAAGKLRTMLYICKKLAIEVDGETTYKNYKGSTSGAKHTQLWDEIIDGYKNERPNLRPENVPAERWVVEMTAEHRALFDAFNWQQDLTLSNDQNAALQAMLKMHIAMQDGPGDDTGVPREAF